MRIGITLNEVVRDFTGQLAYVYSKYIEEYKIEENPVTDWDLIKSFKFKDDHALNTFLYTEAAMEIFAHADQLHDNVITKLNSFITNMVDEEHEVVLISREGDKARCATLFFLSKLGFTGDNIKFVLDTAKKWDGVDVLITANPKALAAKPEGKIAIKINSTYNEDSECDFEFNDIVEIINKEEEFLNNIE